MTDCTHIPNFGDAGGYVCVGDSATWTRGDFTLRATVHADEDTKPTDFDCYSDDHIAAWAADEWCFVGVVVTISAADVELGAASLWGIDCNFPGGDNSYLREVAADLETEALREAGAKLNVLAKVKA